MPSDLSVPRVGTAAAMEPGRVRVSSDSGRSVRQEPAPARPSAEGGKPLPNPSLRLDPGLAMVVIEFRDETGKVRDTIPTQAQLDAYRSWQRTHNAPVPPEMPAGDGGPGEAQPVSGESGAAPRAAAVGAYGIVPQAGHGGGPGEAGPEVPAPARSGAAGTTPAQAPGQGAPVKGTETGAA